MKSLLMKAEVTYIKITNIYCDDFMFKKLSVFTLITDRLMSISQKQYMWFKGGFYFITWRIGPHSRVLNPEFEIYLNNMKPYIIIFKCKNSVF
jgi:hypothetical protein